MRFKTIIGRFSGKKILVIGDLILDRYIYGKVNRISPEAPVPVVDVTGETFLLGGAGNVAHNITALSGQSTIAGIAGRDRAADILVQLLEEKNIHTDGLIRDRRPTTVKARIIAQTQQIVRFDREDRKRLEGKNLSELLEYVRIAAADHDAVIVSDYKKGVVSASLIKTVVTSARRMNRFVAVDPKVGHFHFYRNVSIITPNIPEASQGAGVEIRDEASLQKAGEALLHRLSCESVLITRGEDGMSLFQSDPSGGHPHITHIPTFAQKVFDVTGAGDTVIATYALARVSGADPEEAAIIANHAAGIVVGEVGTAVVTPERLLASLNRPVTA